MGSIKSSKLLLPPLAVSQSQRTLNLENSDRSSAIDPSFQINGNLIKKVQNLPNPKRTKNYRNFDEIYRNKFNFNNDPALDNKIEEKQ